jgi:hypothetical protein
MFQCGGVWSWKKIKIFFLFHPMQFVICDSLVLLVLISSPYYLLFFFREPGCSHPAHYGVDQERFKSQIAAITLAEMTWLYYQELKNGVRNRAVPRALEIQK